MYHAWTKGLRLTLLASAVHFGGAGIVLAAEPSFQEGKLVEIVVMASEPMMQVNGAYHELIDGLYAAPIVEDEKHVFAPLDDILAELGGTVSRQGDAITYGLGERSVAMTIGSETAQVNGEEKSAPFAPRVEDGLVYAPFEFVMEGLGARYSWISSRQRAEALFLLPAGSLYSIPSGKLRMRDVEEKEEAWFAGPEAKALAEALIANQNEDGGWFKLGSSSDLLHVVNREAYPAIRQNSTIDNGTTVFQLSTLAKINAAQPDPALQSAIASGVRYLLDGQYDNGGWSQFFPIRSGYHARITFNDDAVANVLQLLRNVTDEEGDFAFLEASVLERAGEALQKGIDLVLRTQIVQEGQKTVWCAQYDEVSLECARGRSYELASLSGGESANILRFLMSLEAPNQTVIDAVNAGVAYLAGQAIEGKKLTRRQDATLPFGRDRILVDDAGSVVWPRFIELGTNRPLYSNRAGDRLYNYEEVSYERRERYSWLVTTPRDVLNKVYPEWQQKHSPNVNALNP